MINKLVEKIKQTNAPIVVGLDPMLQYIPGYIQKKAYEEYGQTLKGAGEAIWQYNKGIVDAVCDLIPAVKPQIAMYEQFGIEGLIAYKKTIDYCKEKGLVVIGDVKRGDIGSTSEAYAVGHLGKVQVGEHFYAGFDEDFATVNPYLGSDGVKPFMKVCKEKGIEKVRIHRNIGNIHLYKRIGKYFYNLWLRLMKFKTVRYFGMIYDVEKVGVFDDMEIMVHPEYDLNNVLIDKVGEENGYSVGKILQLPKENIILRGYKDI